MVKKVTAVILAAIMTLSVISVTAFAGSQEDEIKFAVTTDIHSRHETELYVNYPENELYFHAKNTGNLYQEAYGILRTMLKQAEDEELDFILICGDTADGGDAIQHENVVEILSEFEEKTSIPVYIVPGNHDYKSNTTPDNIKRMYNEFGYGEALSVDWKTASYTADLPGNLRLIAVDSNNPGADGDGLDDRLYSWIEQQAKLAEAEGKTVIYMMHHPLLDPIPFATVLMKDFIVRDSKELAEKFTQWGIKFVFTGHEHGNNITSYTGNNGQKVYDILTTALTSYPLEYRCISISDGNMNVTNRAIDVCNTDYLVSGYTQAQLDLMQSDYTEYSYEYFNYTIQKKIMRFTQPDFILDKIGVSEGVISDAVTTVMDNVNEALEMPMYKSQTDGLSVEELAGKNGITLPVTEYTSLIQLAASLVAQVYYGNENIPAETAPEGKLLIEALNVMLKYVLAESGNDSVRITLKAIMQNDELAEKFEIFGWNKMYILFADNLYAAEITKLSPLLNKFLIDDDIPDRDCVIPLDENTVAKSNGFADFLNKIKEFFELIVKVFKAFFTAA